MRLYFCCERILSSNGTEHQQMSNDENGQPKKMRWTKRPQEAIEKMLILKVRQRVPYFTAGIGEKTIFSFNECGLT